MGYNKSNFKMIREKYATKYRLARQSAEERTAEVEAAIPALSDVNRQIGALGASMFSVALKEGASGIETVKEKMEALRARRRTLLLENGYPEDYCTVKYECPLCGDTGYVDCKMCACMKRDLVMAAYETSGLGRLLSEQTFDNFNLDYYNGNPQYRQCMQINAAYMQRYAQTFSLPDGAPESLLLMGGTGLGKTHLSTAVARCVIDKGYDVRYVTAINLLADFEAKRFGSAGADADDATADYLSCDLLILDDLGTEVGNQFTLSCIYNLIDSRLNSGLPTVISTNLGQQELRSRYNDRVTSRLLGAFRLLFFRGTDVRIQKLSEKQ